MIYEIKNSEVSVKVSSLGAEPVSMVKDGVEYLWQGDKTYWASHATNLFPICGRLTDGKYTYDGKTYEMMLHGFAKISEFSLSEKAEDKLVLTLTDNEETYKMYPFHFVYTVEISLNGSEISVRYTVNNKSDCDMYFTLGGHPGFNVPLDGNGDFSDYYLEFSGKEGANYLVMKECYMTDEVAEFPLENGVKKTLSHSIFDNDAVFLCKSAKKVTLKSDKTDRAVTVKFDDMKYLGLWHKPLTEAPYICLEPWLGVPAYFGKIDDLKTKRDMITLSPDNSYTAGYSVVLK